MDMALVKRVVLLVVVLATLMDMKQQTEAWRPQGRFGKRMSPLEQAELAEGEFDFFWANMKNVF